MKKILEGYLETAIWADLRDKNGEPIDACTHEIDGESVETAEKDITKFIDLAKDLCNFDERAGHDFWLTRNGHGAGFWDGDYEHGDKLTEIIHSNFRGTYIYKGDDGVIYIT